MPLAIAAFSGLWGFIEMYCLHGLAQDQPVRPDPLAAEAAARHAAALGPAERDRNGPAQALARRRHGMLSGAMNDAVSITRDLVRCPSVTPADAGALGVLENVC